MVARVDELLIIRHAIAEEHRPGTVDASRELTEKGRDKMVRAARGLHRLLPGIDRIFTSPLIRAAQTAAILSKRYPTSQTESLPLLAPGSECRELIYFLQRLSERRVALVGHEPGLSHLITRLLCADEGSGLTLKKGGMALLRFPDLVEQGEGVLDWLLTPKQLRLIGDTG